MTLTRRGVLRAASLLSGATAAAACTPGTPAPAISPSANAVTMNSPNLLIAYFSRPGENYWNGGRRTLTIGNTEALAGMLADRLRCTVYRIEASDPYPASYDDTVARNVREQDTNARPAIARPLPNLAAYDVVLLGSPIWNLRPPMIMNTFLDRVDLRGKTILPFVTYAVSGLGSTTDLYRAAAPGATVGDGLAVRGEQVTDAAQQITRWLTTTGLHS
ncbi:flavodoxin [Actinoplanes sp. CA-030573]|uniref:flavodoxin n=1 Tax=Actinoplanes sp. CA-030573 TaxID=3239898 RepID=UPI003D92CD56